MRVDLHCHVKLSKKQTFSLLYFQQSIEEAKQAGLQAIAMTEHFNTTNFHQIYEELDRHYPYEDHYYNVDGFRVFPGMEVDVAGGGHLLLIGTRDTILMMRQWLAPHTAKANFVSLEQLLDWRDQLDLLMIGAHPYRNSNPLTSHSPQLLQRLDALDINGKDLYSYGIDMMHRVQRLAKHYGLPAVAGSDTHHPLQFGAVWNQFVEEISDYRQLREAIQNKQYTVGVDAQLNHRVKAASLVKKLLKERGQVIEAFI